MDNDLRSQLRALTNLAIEGFGQEQEHCAAITAAVEQVENVIGALGEKQESTHSLAVAAVGGGGDVPESAAAMVGASGQVAAAVKQLQQTAALIKTQTDTAYTRAGEAAENGRQYLAVI
jgi:hypothetical protein